MFKAHLGCSESVHVKSFTVTVQTFPNVWVFLSPYLQNAACDYPGDFVACSEHHVRSVEPHSWRSPGRALISGNSGRADLHKGGVGQRERVFWVTRLRVAVLLL